MTPLNRSFLTKLAVTGLLASTLAACSGGTTVGNPDATYTPPKSEKPSVKPTKTKTNEPTKEPTTEPTQTGPKPKGAKVAAVNGYQWEPIDVQVQAGGKLTITNNATDSEHSFTIEDEGIDSGALANGESYSFTVELAPNTYDFRCGLVTYMVGGKLTVY